MLQQTCLGLGVGVRLYGSFLWEGRCVATVFTRIQGNVASIQQHHLGHGIGKGKVR